MARSTLSFSARISAASKLVGSSIADQGEQLQQVVLQHVAGGAGGVVEAGPGADADVLGHGDLHRVDVLGVPQRLEQVVREAQRHDVLDGLLAQVVVDAEHVVAGEDVVDQVVERLGGRQVGAERLLHHHPPPAAGLAVVGHPGAGELLEHHRERGRRDGEVERRVAGDAVRARAGRPGSRRGVSNAVVVVERTADELDVAGQPGPDLVPPRGAGVLAARPRRPATRSRRRPSRGGRSPSTTKPGGSSPRLARSYTAGSSFFRARSPVDTEDHQSARLRDPRQPPVLRIAQRVHGASFLTQLRAHVSPAAHRPRRGAGSGPPPGRSGAAGAPAVPGRPGPAGHRRPARPAAHRRCTACPAPPGPRPPPR